MPASAKNNQPLKVLITGVYGLIGNLMYRRLARQPALYDVYGSSRRAVNSQRADPTDIQPVPAEHFTLADLSDAQAVQRAVDGMHVVLHIGAAPGPEAPFETVLQSNIVGIHNVLEACQKAGVRRLVYASSIMVSFGYFRFSEPYRSIYHSRFDNVPASIPLITHLDAPRPTESYSASKVFAEALCRTYHDAYGISTVCLRIGYVNKEDICDRHAYVQSVWFSQRDCANCIELALKATEKPVFEICYGVSDNQYRWVDLEHTRAVLGYIPLDSNERTLAAARSKPTQD